MSEEYCSKCGGELTLDLETDEYRCEKCFDLKECILSDEAILKKLIDESVKILPFADILKERGYEVSFFITENYSTKKYESRVTATKKLKCDSNA